MGAMAVAVDKTGGNVVPKVVFMLKELTHRGTDAHGVATPNSVRVTKTIEETSTENINSSVALGHNLSRTVSKDRPQPVLGNDFALVFEGRLFPSPNISEVNQVLKRLNGNPRKNAEHILTELDGSYVFAIAQHKKAIIGRDSLGANPLYYGENESICAVASERKALWTLGIKNVRSFPPGNLAVMNAHGFVFHSIKTVTQPLIKPMKLELAAKRLQELLLESTKARISNLEKVVIAFSGGLDSSVIAVLAKTCGAEVHLVSVGLQHQPEIQHVKVAAKALKLPLHFQTYMLDDVKRVLPKVLWLIEEPNMVKANIALPIYWAAEVTSKLGCKVLLVGQGSDELFGGYQKYLRIYSQSGTVAVRDTMYRDVALSYEANLQRDNQVCSFHGVELRLPFLDWEVVCFSLSLPVSLKIEFAENSLRKKVLRRAAQNLGMPPFIANRPKRAIQYSTGVNKALRRLAREEGLSLQEYVKKVFRKVYPNGGA